MGSSELELADLMESWIGIVCVFFLIWGISFVIMYAKLEIELSEVFLSFAKCDGTREVFSSFESMERLV